MNDRNQEPSGENIKSLVHFVSLGCPKNQVDGEVILGYLKREGFGFTETPEDAEIILVNTCAFIQKATEEALETILTMAQLKESGACRRLIVTGCLPQRYGEELLDLLPEVDLFLGTGEITAVVRRLKDLDRNGSRACHSRAPNYLYTDLDPRIRLAPSHTAYVKIAEGCSQPVFILRRPEYPRPPSKQDRRIDRCRGARTCRGRRRRGDPGGAGYDGVRRRPEAGRRTAGTHSLSGQA